MSVFCSDILQALPKMENIMRLPKFLQRKEPEQESERIEPLIPDDEKEATIDAYPDISMSGRSREQNLEFVELHSIQERAPTVTGHAMDSAIGANAFNGGYGAVNQAVLMYFARTSSFMGYNAMAIVAQNRHIARACSIYALEAVKRGYKLGINDNTEVTPEQLKAIESEDKRLKVIENLVEGERFNNVFGVRHILYRHKNPIFDYSKPFNPDSWREGDYVGMSQIDPNWIIPEVEQQDLTDPSRITFYEPEFWTIQGKRYHRSHFVILRGEPVADILKPTYRYGGISLVQSVYERLYNAERTANEAPALTMTKRMGVQKVDLAAVAADKDQFIKNQEAVVAHRDNYAKQFIGKDEEFDQIDTSLTDLDDVIMNQFALFCSLIPCPVSFFMGTGFTGFSTGETDYDFVISNVETLQGGNLERILHGHYERLKPSFIIPRLGFDPEIDIIWNPIKVMSDKERAEVRSINANADSLLSNAGAIDGDDIRNRIINDEQSGYSGIEEYDEVEKDEEGSDLEIEGRAVGARLSALVNAASKVSSGELSIDQAVEIVINSLSVNRETAIKMLGEYNEDLNKEEKDHGEA